MKVTLVFLFHQVWDLRSIQFQKFYIPFKYFEISKWWQLCILDILIILIEIKSLKLCIVLKWVYSSVKY